MTLLTTTRLLLSPLTPATSAAAIADLPLLSQLLDADIPADWPPVDLADVQPLLAAKLAQHPEQVGWHGWYIIARPGVLSPRATLIGSAGCSRWGNDNQLQFGYGLLPAFFRQGFATEAALALINWIITQPGVSRIEATTFERHTASVRILQRCGFTLVGPSPDDATAPDSDRQGRGTLLLFTRTVA